MPILSLLPHLLLVHIYAQRLYKICYWQISGANLCDSRWGLFQQCIGNAFAEVWRPSLFASIWSKVSYLVLIKHCHAFLDLFNYNSLGVFKCILKTLVPSGFGVLFDKVPKGQHDLTQWVCPGYLVDELKPWSGVCNCLWDQKVEYFLYHGLRRGHSRRSYLEASKL